MRYPKHGNETEGSARPVRVREDRRGMVLAFVALGAAMLIGAVALAVDVGMLMTARTESQRVADLAALAGAGALIVSPGNEPLARQEAIEFAAQNEVRNAPVTLQPSDVVVDLDEQTVRASVFHTDARGNAMPTFFARVFGVQTVDVSTTAVAEVYPASAINCLLPLAMPDRWEEVGGDPVDYDPEFGDYYIPWDPDAPDAPYTGYSADDIGTEIVIKPNQGGGDMNQSWYYPWRPPGQSGGSDYRTNISSCVDPSIEFYVGIVVDTEPGAMIGPTKQGFQDLIALDPSATWNSVQNCVVTSGNEGSSDPAVCRYSPRIRPMPMFDPRQEPDPGAKPFTFTNFVAVFVDRIQGNDVWAYFVGFTGIDPAGGGGAAGAGPMFKTIRLIE